MGDSCATTDDCVRTAFGDLPGRVEWIEAYGAGASRSYAI